VLPSLRTTGGFIAVFFHLLFSVTFSFFSTRTNLEKKLAQTTTKYEEEKASVKKHHSTIAKVWILLMLFKHEQLPDSRAPIAYQRRHY